MFKQDFQLLTPREFDCLNLLRWGVPASEAAKSLGIALSTFQKHLLGARRKLGVRRTTDALLLLERAEVMEIDSGMTSNQTEFDGSPLVTSFADRLMTMNSHALCWNELVATAETLGVKELTLGLCVEPESECTNGAFILGTTHDTSTIDLYHGDRPSSFDDPMVKHIATGEKPLFLSGKIEGRAFLILLPPDLREALEVTITTRMEYAVSLPLRDAVFGVPFGAGMGLDRELWLDLSKGHAEPLAQLQSLLRVYRAVIESKGLIVGVARLTDRQRTVLKLLVRGFQMREVAEHMGISQRAAEQLLANCRKVLKARTTASAIYRATVMRIIP